MLFANVWDFNALMANFIAAALFGTMGILLLVIGFKVFEFITPKLNLEKELAEKNIAVGIVVGALILGISLIVYASIHG